MNIISVENFSKYFGTVKVISDLSFNVNEGEIFAFLGANGSGKTTTIRCSLGILQPSSGELLINGKKYTQAASSILGYLPEERGLYVTSKVLETMIYFGQIKGMAYEDAKKSAETFLERVGLQDKANITINKLSSGQQQKIQLGITIINNPSLLILDEPTKGLDPVNRELLLDILYELNKNGTTILFSTHQMEEVEKIADRMLMIKNGTSVLYGSVDEVKRSFGENVIRVEYDGALKADSNVFTGKIEAHYAELVPAEKVTPNEVLAHLLKQKVSIRRFEINTYTLNEIFLKVQQA